MKYIAYDIAKDITDGTGHIAENIVNDIAFDVVNDIVTL